MKKLAIKLSFLSVLSGLYLAGLSAAAAPVTPRFLACCTAGETTCCGRTCAIGPYSCTATN